MEFAFNAIFFFIVKMLPNLVLAWVQVFFFFSHFLFCNHTGDLVN
jgi:hypothetical protein